MSFNQLELHVTVVIRVDIESEMNAGNRLATTVLPSMPTDTKKQALGFLAESSNTPGEMPSCIHYCHLQITIASA